MHILRPMKVFSCFGDEIVVLQAHSFFLVFTKRDVYIKKTFTVISTILPVIYKLHYQLLTDVVLHVTLSNETTL